MATVTSPSSQDRRIPAARSGRNGNVSLGEMLRRAREHRGFTLERIARETRIPQRHLEALEHDNLSAIPSGFYRRAELRTYAQAIGLDQRLAVAELESALMTAETHEPARKTRQTSGEGFSLRDMAIVLIGVVVTAALLGRAMVEPAPLLQHVDTPVAAEPALAPALSSSPAPDTVRPELQGSDAGPQVTEAAPAPVPTGPVTELIVTTQPAGARVTVNGIAWGISPSRIRYLDPGEKRIRVSKEGYATVERVLSVAEGRRQALDIQLETAP